MFPPRACASLLPLSLSLACASTSAPVADAPQCEPEPTIAVSDPMPPRASMVPRFTAELVDLRLFVVTQAGGDEEAIPEPIRASSQCDGEGCSLVISPRLLGRSNREMRLEVGEGIHDDVFVLEAQPRVADGRIDLEMSARLLPQGAPAHEAQRFSFSGVLEPGQITHVGTFYATSHDDHTVGPQVFAVAEYTTPESH